MARIFHCSLFNFRERGLSRTEKNGNVVRKIEKYKPAVASNVLILLAGLAWGSVGAMLLVRAGLWLSRVPGSYAYLFEAVGAGGALLVHRFGFARIVDRNLARILPMKDKRCLFSFIPCRSYLIILVMIAMGVELRHSSFPKEYLAILYTTMGLALLLSGARYIRVFLRETDGRRSS